MGGGKTNAFDVFLPYFCVIITSCVWTAHGKLMCMEGESVLKVNACAFLISS